MALPREFRYDTRRTWFKGNTRLHSTGSDGGKTLAEITQLYVAQGYHFLCATDHWKASHIKSARKRGALLWLDGVELDGKDYADTYYHVVCLGTFKGLKPAMGLVAAMESARKQGGFLILAHPHWTGNNVEEALRWGFDGVEIYNHVCHWLNGKSDGRVHWNAALVRYPNMLAFAADDAHIRPEHPGWNGGWIMVNAATLSREALMAAIRQGNYYSSTGPKIRSMALRGDLLTVRTSPVRFARLVGPGSKGLRLGAFDGSTLTSVSFKLPADWAYIYLELEDAKGRRAWTNNLWRIPS